MVKRYQRMSKSSIKAIVLELDRWALGQLGAKLTWSILEKNTGFSRQALEAKPEIKAAYRNAKNSLRNDLVQTKEEVITINEELLIENKRLNLENKHRKEQELLWLARWQRIAYHIREKLGYQVSQIDKKMPDNKEIPSKKETEKILKPFDKDIPPSGRS